MTETKLVPEIRSKELNTFMSCLSTSMEQGPDSQQHAIKLNSKKKQQNGK